MPYRAFIPLFLALFFPRIAFTEPLCLPDGYQTALMIIDMQESFTKNARKNISDNSNKEILKRLIEIQRAIIADAVKQNKPILLIEYNFAEPTLYDLRELLFSYPKLVEIKKTTDSAFADPKAILTIAEFAKNYKIKKFEIIGANGGACVQETINDGLLQGCQLEAINDGIADFNFESFIYPYYYKNGSSKNFSQKHSALPPMAVDHSIEQTAIDYGTQ